MPFPDAPRVIYQRNPLIEVIAQLRFPPILKIDGESPVRFQDRVRADFPFYEVRIEENILPIELRQRLPSEIVELFTSQTRSKVYDFGSVDQGWQLSLAKDFIALSTHRYERWQEFRTKLSTPVQCLLDEYAPAFYIRLGLRYRNVIQRSALGLADTPWSQLLQPYIAGPLAAHEFAASAITNLAQRMEVQLTDGVSVVRIVHGFHQMDEELCYLIDSDLFTEERTEVQDGFNKLDYLNRCAGRVFRWCITDRLHLALEPLQP